MVLIPGTSFSYSLKANDNFIPHPDGNRKDIKIDSFLIDKYPVTNLEYYK